MDFIWRNSWDDWCHHQTETRFGPKRKTQENSFCHPARFRSVASRIQLNNQNRAIATKTPTDSVWLSQYWLRFQIMKRKSVQQYRERTEAGSMKKRSKLTWRSILGYFFGAVSWCLFLISQTLFLFTNWNSSLCCKSHTESVVTFVEISLKFIIFANRMAIALI